MWQADKEAMRDALARHDELVRQAVEANQGYAFKTVGDGFCVAFSTATEAVAAALEAQRLIRAESWPAGAPVRVRMALHTGAADLSNGDYVGLSVNRASRLLSIGHGGQCLLSQTVFDLVRDHLPSGVTARDVGSHLLRDLSRPEQVYQLDFTSPGEIFPPLRSLSVFPHNLPQQVTSFIGRESEIQSLETLLSKGRLLTLTGAGGTGKSRISLQLAAQVLEHFPDGAWFVELAPITDPALVPLAVAEALNLKGVSDFGGIADGLEHRSLLLILDNCEHLLEPCAKLMALLLKRCPQIKILASSREPVAITGEQTFRVPSLTTPKLGQPQTVESLTHFEAVRLFVDRATMVNPEFAVSNESVPYLASLCARLDGIPLAIELAAARVRMLSVEEIEKRLDQRFKLLTGGSRSALPRQQTLRALVDWSYDLLSSAERTMLERVSVFVGGWKLPLAELACTDDAIEAWEVLDLLTSLSDKSLVTIDLSGEEAWFGLLETVRQYGLEKLEEGGEVGNMRRRHAHALIQFTSPFADRLNRMDSGALTSLDVLSDNTWACVLWLSQNEPETAANLVGNIWRHWLIRGRLHESRDACDRVMQALPPDAKPETWAIMRCLSSYLRLVAGEFENAFEEAKAAQDDAQRSGDPSLIARSLNAFGNAWARCHPDKTEGALEAYGKAAAIYESLGDEHGAARVLSNAASECLRLDECKGLRLMRESYERYQRIGYRLGAALVQGNVGEFLHLAGRFEEALPYHLEALHIRIEINERPAIAGSLEGIVTCLAALPDRHADPTTLIQVAACAARLRGDTGFKDLMGFESSTVEKLKTEYVEVFAREWPRGLTLSPEAALDLVLPYAKG